MACLLFSSATCDLSSLPYIFLCNLNENHETENKMYFSDQVGITSLLAHRWQDTGMQNQYSIAIYSRT